MTKRLSGHFSILGLVSLCSSLLGTARQYSSETFAILSLKPRSHVRILIGWFSNRTGTSLDDGKMRGKNLTRLPESNLPLCHWSSQLFDLRAPSSTDVPVLLLNQPNSLERGLFPISETLRVGYKLSAQQFQGSFGWKSFTYEWLIVALIPTIP